MDIETQNLIDDLRAELKSVKDEWQLARDNLLWPALIGPGMLRFGGNIMQLDNHGAQIESGGGVPVAALWFVDGLVSNPTTLTTYAYIAGEITDTGSAPNLYMWSQNPAAHAFIGPKVLSNDSAELEAQLVADEVSSLAWVLAQGASAIASWVWTNTYLTLTALSGDPGAATDGSVWYRSNQFTGRRNGATKDFLMTGDVSAGWAPAVTTQTSGYTAVDGDFIICNSATAFTVTLPTPTANRRIVVKNINTGAVTVDGASTDTIDDQLSIILGMYDAVSLIADGTEWWIF